jgi:predicted acylesterase/phospholipase RssA
MRAPGTPSRIGLALAGGGPLGAIYEVGALCALDEALRGMDFNALDGYVGVSAGSFIAAGLANGISPRQMCRAFIENDPDTDIVLFEPDQRDPEMSFANLFSYAQRRVVAEHAYQRTRADLRERAAVLAPLLARHGIAIDAAVLADPHRHLVNRRRLARGRSVRTLRRLEQTPVELERMLPGPPAARAGSAAPAQAALTQARSRSASERGEWTVTPPNDRP